MTLKLQSYPAARGTHAVKERTIVRERQAAELRRLAKKTREAERERKLLALADEWEGARQLEETATSPTK